MKKPLGLFLLILTWSLVIADEPPDYVANPGIISLGGQIIWFTVQGPNSYVTVNTGELPDDAIKMGEVRGEACQHGLSLPISANLQEQSGQLSGAIGQGGYERVIALIKKKYPNIRGLYDVKVDLHTVRVLLIYSKYCTEIAARAFR